MTSANRGSTVAGIVVAALLLTAAVFGLVHFISSFAYVSTDDAYVQGRIHQIAAKVPGTALRVQVTDDQAVKQNDVLLEIDPADYAVKSREAEAVLTAEEARLSEAEARVSAAAAAQDIQETTMRQANTDSVRAERIFVAGALSKEKVEKARTNRDLALAQVKAAQEGVIQAKATVTLEKALVEQRRAALENARLQLSYTKVVAPSDGVVTRKSVEAGDQVGPGRPLMAIVALDDVWVVANFKETQLQGVHPGQDVEVRIDAFSGQVFHGRIDTLMAGTGAAFTLFPPENALGNYVKVVQRVPVRIVFDKQVLAGHALRVGMSVVARVKVK